MEEQQHDDRGLPPPPDQQPQQQQHYRYTHMLGDGTYGTVWLAETRGELVAVKRLKTFGHAAGGGGGGGGGAPSSSPSAPAQAPLAAAATPIGSGGASGASAADLHQLPHSARREVQALRRVGAHAHVVGLRGVAVEAAPQAPRRSGRPGGSSGGGGGGQEGGGGSVLLVFEALDANLHQTLQAAAGMLSAAAAPSTKSGGSGGGAPSAQQQQQQQQQQQPPAPPILPDHVVREWAWQLLSGLAAVHRSGLMHRDVKPENVLVGLFQQPPGAMPSAGGAGGDGAASPSAPAASVAASAGAPLSTRGLQRRLRACFCAPPSPSNACPPAVLKLADFGLARDAPECARPPLAPPLLPGAPTTAAFSPPRYGGGGGGGSGEVDDDPSAAAAAACATSTSSSANFYDPPLTGYVSTRWYRAPEVLLRAATYGRAVDVWAAGAVVAEIAALRPLFPGATERDTLLLIAHGLGPPGARGWPEGERLAQARGLRLLAASPQTPPLAPAKRGGGGGGAGAGGGAGGGNGVAGGWASPEAAAAVARLLPAGVSPLAADLVACLCAWDPAARPTAGAALRHPFFAGVGSGAGGPVPRALVPPRPLEASQGWPPPPPRAGRALFAHEGSAAGGAAGGGVPLPPPGVAPRGLPAAASPFPAGPPILPQLVYPAMPPPLPLPLPLVLPFPQPMLAPPPFFFPLQSSHLGGQAGGAPTAPPLCPPPPPPPPPQSQQQQEPPFQQQQQGRAETAADRLLDRLLHRRLH